MVGLLTTTGTRSATLDPDERLTNVATCMINIQKECKLWAYQRSACTRPSSRLSMLSNTDRADQRMSRAKLSQSGPRLADAHSTPESQAVPSSKSLISKLGVAAASSLTAEHRSLLIYNSRKVIQRQVHFSFHAPDSSDRNRRLNNCRIAGNTSGGLLAPMKSATITRCSLPHKNRSSSTTAANVHK